MLQKIAYFATVAGLPTGLQYTAASYGPFASNLKPAIARMQNNGLIEEKRRGRMLEVRTGPYLNEARKGFGYLIPAWDETLDRIVDLAIRFDTHRAEIAATVHFAASSLSDQLQRTPTISEVIDFVESWKIRRRPPLQREDIVRAIAHLGTRGWLQVRPDAASADAVDELMMTGTVSSLTLLCGDPESVAERADANEIEGLE